MLSVNSKASFSCGNKMASGKVSNYERMDDCGVDCECNCWVGHVHRALGARARALDGRTNGRDISCNPSHARRAGILALMLLIVI
jgi:hypothetical protein